MSDYDVIVIGAGNAGLTAAASLARAGKKTLLLERHNIAGGCATSFVRGRFEFEVALHQLSGFGSADKPSDLYSQFAELDVLKRITPVKEEEIYRIFSTEGIDLTLPASREGTIEALSQAFPEEAGAIQRFFDLMLEVLVQSGVMRHLAENNVDESQLNEKYASFLKYGLKTTQDVLDEFFSSAKLKQILSVYWSYNGTPPSRWRFLSYAGMLWSYLEYKPTHFLGGSQAVSNAIQDSFLEAGGEVRFNCPVDQILVQSGKATGVKTAFGEEISASTIVSNVSALITYRDLLDPEDVPDNVFTDFSSRTVGPSAFTIYMGLNCEPAELGIHTSTSFITSTLDDNEVFRKAKTLADPQYACFSCYDVADSTFSPEGACQASLLCLQYAEPWLALPPEKYAETKYIFAEKLLNLAETCYPGLRDVMEEVEVATPLTHMRYLGHPGGAIYGFEQSPTDNAPLRRPPQAISNLYLAGSWVSTGGFEPTLKAGSSLARKIIRAA